MADDPDLTPTTTPRKGDAGAPRSTSGETVTIGCRMPNGLLLRLHEFIEYDEPLYGGGYRRSKIARPVGEAIKLNGCAINVAAVAAGEMPEFPIIGGFGLTSGVPKEFWDAWHEQNKTTELVRNGIVFVAKNEAAGTAMARERAGQVRSGLEPINPQKLPAEFQPKRTAGGGITGIQTSTSGT